ncbi:ABC transporter substrate-binding protein [Phycicoccus sp. DTK01]|uniref:ABC transporter substrate-binding protein n=1 Tax=Phycicoccus sp. DTK01 TaxID=2785745 RepID=UPI001A8D17D3|nr:extracellular solute-binding protein [Phycicoccus sp. DTK01]GIL34117.1 hypothetical protein PDTK01_01940 [Phycicoccus sp. DTK01]
MGSLRVVAVPIAVAAGLLLAGCGEPVTGGGGSAGTLATGGWDSVVKAADQEGTATVYSILVPAVNDRIEKGFEAKYPDIDLQIVRVLGTEIDAKLNAERDTKAPTADLVINANYDSMLKWAKAGDLFDAQGPNATDEQWKSANGLIDGKIQMTAVTGIVMAWNTDIVKDPPKTLTDFLDPRFKGQIGVPDNNNLPLASFWSFLKDQEPDYWDKLVAQQPKVYPSAVPLQEALVSGEIGVTFYSVPAILKPVMAQGAPVDMAVPTPMWGPQTLSYMPKWNSAHPNAAQVLFDWLGSADGQTAVGTDNVSVLDVPGTLQSFKDTKVVDFDTQLDPSWVDAEQADWRKVFGR